MLDLTNLQSDSFNTKVNKTKDKAKTLNKYTLDKLKDFYDVFYLQGKINVLDTLFGENKANDLEALKNGNVEGLSDATKTA
ncbi:hypothetical protein [Campylobacter pinnipediorum]|uniref:Uncharacterized protein n=1 Tax=Campylobacter pinnipediorum subsp. pinnipediorum TaxID=1660067 RepID=A0AAX0LDZ0_9BACT|nr:hypothetical protein [Campylobacter pinnipediorum]AQW80652.1 hypothetical protein CPIN17260_0315 [Campylobacter pinnipediorum subsp. pinnipediorum]OPA76577.1 hypothetical protein BFG05_05150 [Campylobacter pinnipediorum subsp. pinnipediorum]OPA82022.1 hypothetical protein BFG04_07895 [Campylobacter pinnipediorum subsp. pinnipediorum]